MKTFLVFILLVRVLLYYGYATAQISVSFIVQVEMWRFLDAH